MALTHITRLYFGLACPGGGAVNEGQLADFRDNVLSSRFPDGFTWLTAEGGWRDVATGVTIREPSVVVEVAHDGSDEALGALRMVAGTYKVLFGQDAVMVVTQVANVEFL